jgi:hypothetical protein
MVGELFEAGNLKQKVLGRLFFVFDDGDRQEFSFLFLRFFLEEDYPIIILTTSWTNSMRNFNLPTTWAFY